jgi:adenosylcobinamide kinase / adenosylcobinamide-phosphate guanylyltransferase
MKTFLIGGARSGKSSLAAAWASESTEDVCCLVTGVATDAEMAARIEKHRAERPAHWHVREAPQSLGRALREVSGKHPLVLIDCLTVWTSNCLWPPERIMESTGSDLPPDQERWRAERDDFLAALRTCGSDVIVVSNEVGSGIVPFAAAARLFRDEHGWLNQGVAAACDATYLVVAGMAVRLSSQR